jgi:hypothetical protein
VDALLGLTTRWIPHWKKLDRVLMSREWEIMFLGIYIFKKPRKLSDHNPLIMSIVVNTLNQSREFRFELNWISHPDFVPKVQEIWQAPTRDSNCLDRILFKIKKVNKYLKGWGFNLSGMRKQRKKDIQENLEKLEVLEELGPLNADQVKKRLELKLELFNILDEEELF